MELYNEDCLKIMDNIPENSIDCIITDPPYCINYKTNRRLDKSHKFCHSIQNDDSKQFLHSYIQKCYKILKNNSALFMFCSSHKVELFLTELKSCGFNWKNTIVWVKNNWTAGDLKAGLGKQYENIILVHKGRCLRKNNYRYSDVWNFDGFQGKVQFHANQKPVDLLKRCIELYTSEGDVVFDGCMGSGSTGVACKEMNRDFIGCEIDEEYFNIAKDRIYGGMEV